MTSPIRGPVRHDLVVQKHGKNFCAAPFNSLFEGPKGLVSTCCKTREAIGYTNESSLEEMYNSEHAKSVRKAFLEGKKHPQCVQCWQYEDQTGLAASNRQSSNMLGFDTIDEAVANTLPDGTMTKQSPAWLDLLWTNKCNFACLGCKPDVSSTIARKYKDEYALLAGMKPHEYYPDMDLWQTNNEAKIRYVIDHADSLEVIHLNGGEPFMSEGIFDLLDEMLKYGLNKKIRIWSHTNGSITTSYKGKDLVEDYLSKWGDMARIVMSQDGYGPRGEYIRYGYRDDVWLRTYRRIHEANVELSIQTCWNMLNAMVIDDIGAWYMENLPKRDGVLNGKLGIWKNMSLGVEMLRIHEPTRQRCLQALRNLMESGNHPKGWEHTLKDHYKLMSVRKDLNKQKWIWNCADGIEAIDRKRGTNFDKTFPELVEFMNYLRDRSENEFTLKERFKQTGHQTDQTPPHTS